MKRIFLTALMAGIFGNSYAACPVKIDGTYSGLGSYVESKIQTMNPFAVALGYAEGWAQVWRISGSTLTVLKNYKSGTNGDGTTEEPFNTPLSISFDRATCSGQISVPGSGFIGFVVSNSGQHIQATEGSTDGPSFSTFDMYKQ